MMTDLLEVRRRMDAVIKSTIDKLNKYKKFKGEIFVVTVRNIKSGTLATIKTDLNLDDKVSMALYRISLLKHGIEICDVYKKPIPTFITRIILFLEYIFLGYCAY